MSKWLERERRVLGRTVGLIPIAYTQDAKHIVVKKQTGGATKFKVRCSKYLYTLVVSDQDKANKLESSLPPGMCTRLYTRAA
jgi:large subunit ribosomal protein L38e